MGYWRGTMIKAFFDANYPEPRKIEEAAVRSWGLAPWKRRRQ
ncbi:MAG TPA: hypothetical protein VNI77_05235 [Nitrososphaera sp.]|nr:hypothetical protein [Nitrososphaera sp.]